MKPASAAASSSPANFVELVGSSGASPSSPSTSGSSASSTDLAAPSAEVVDADGNLLIADAGDDEIDVVAVGENPGYQLGAGAQWITGRLYVIAGGAGAACSACAATSAKLDSPSGVALDARGNVVFSNTGDDELMVLAVSTSNPGYSTSGWVDGDIYELAGGSAYVPSWAGTPAQQTQFAAPTALSLDADGNIVFADTADDEVDVLSVGTDPGYVLAPGATWRTDEVYVLAGEGGVGPSPRGEPVEDAALVEPRGVAVDRDGNLVISDSGDNSVEVEALGANPGYVLQAPGQMARSFRLPATGRRCRPRVA